MGAFLFCPFTNTGVNLKSKGGLAGLSWPDHLLKGNFNFQTVRNMYPQRIELIPNLWGAGILKHDKAQMVEISDSEDTASDTICNGGVKGSLPISDTLDNDTLWPTQATSTQATLILPGYRSSGGLDIAIGDADD